MKLVDLNERMKELIADDVVFYNILGASRGE
jgi:hypothetical protein